MKKTINLLSFMLICALLLSSCQKPYEPPVNKDDGDSSTTSLETEFPTVNNQTNIDAVSTDMFTSRDLNAEYKASEAVQITLSGNKISCSSDAVTINGTTAVIREEGTFILSGTLDNGMIVVNAGEKDKPHIILNGVTVSNESSAALYILEADKVIVTLADGTKNELNNGGKFTAIDDNNIDGAIFSKQDLSFNGSGSLTVTSPAGHGIVCKDDLVFAGGTYTVNASAHTIDANDSVRMTHSVLTLTAGKDGIHAENSDDPSLGFIYAESGTLNIEAEGDGISAGSYVQIEDGTFTILAGGGSQNGTSQNSVNYGGFPGDKGFGGRDFGGRGIGGFMSQPPTTQTSESEESTSMKGIKATGTLLLNGGVFSINTADDAVHSNTSVTVNGGTWNIASGDDAFHADEKLQINAGTISISESYEGLEGLHVLVSGGNITLTAKDDGINAAGGTDSSGMGGRDNGKFGGPGRGGGMFGGGSSNGSIVISGGEMHITASGDGIDANGTLEIAGGYTVVTGPTQGDTATLDYDKSGVISGGTFIGTGAAGMAQTFSSSEKQGVISLRVNNQAAGTEITVTDASEKTLLTHKPDLSFAVVILSCPEMTKGEKYTVTIGSTARECTAE